MMRCHQEQVPTALLLQGSGLDLQPAVAATVLGWYRLETGVTVNGRPAWRQAAHSDRWLAYDGDDAWFVQLEEHLGQKRGMLKLSDPNATSPDRRQGGKWQAPRCASRGWVEAKVTCRAGTSAELVTSPTWERESPYAKHEERHYCIQSLRRFSADKDEGSPKGWRVWRRSTPVPARPSSQRASSRRVVREFASLRVQPMHM